MVLDGFRWFWTVIDGCGKLCLVLDCFPCSRLFWMVLDENDLLWMDLAGSG